MISFIKGEPLFVEADSLTVDVNGVGYELHCSSNTLTDFDGQSQINAFIHTHVREDAFLLFGFSSEIEKKVFLSLLKVNGIGPKMALTILSAASVNHIVSLIEAEDAKGLAKLPRIGKKTAEQMILSLKGKLVRAEDSLEKPQQPRARVEIISALVHLGFRLTDVEKVVEQMNSNIDLQEGVRQGLAALTN